MIAAGYWNSSTIDPLASAGHVVALLVFTIIVAGHNEATARTISDLLGLPAYDPGVRVSLNAWVQTQSLVEPNACV